MAADNYVQQVRLLVQVLPFIAEEACFALKGGTAINLFYRDLPRLSIDIDLTYLALQDRAASLADIDTALARLQGTEDYREGPLAFLEKRPPVWKGR